MSHYNSVCCLCGLSLSYITAGLSSAVCLCITFFSAYPGCPHPPSPFLLRRARRGRLTVPHRGGARAWLSERRGCWGRSPDGARYGNPWQQGEALRQRLLWCTGTGRRKLSLAPAGVLVLLFGGAAAGPVAEAHGREAAALCQGCGHSPAVRGTARTVPRAIPDRAAAAARAAPGCAQAGC